MSVIDVYKELKENKYPGRCIIIGKSPDGNHAVIAYFIMGRSENSRNRIFVETADGIKTEAFDESKLSDPSLVIYTPVRTYKNFTIVTNGDQTDTIYEFLKNGDTFENALKTRRFEPDSPIFTPRISGLVKIENSSMEYKLSILKSAAGNESSCERFTFDYSEPVSGVGHLIHTYLGDGNPVPSFSGEPKRIALEDDIKSFTEKLWNSLNEDNKISLFTRYIDIKTGEVQTKLINKNSNEGERK